MFKPDPEFNELAEVQSAIGLYLQLITQRRGPFGELRQAVRDPNYFASNPSGFALQEVANALEFMGYLQKRLVAIAEKADETREARERRKKRSKK